MLADDLKVKIKELKTKFDGIEAASDIPALTAKYEALKEAAATETAENCGCGAGGCAAPEDEPENESVCASCASAEDCDRYCGCGK